MGDKKTTTTTKSNKQSEYFGQSNSSQQSTGHQSASSTSSTTPDLPEWFLPMKQQVAQGYGDTFNSYHANATKPLYGMPQQAQFQQSLNDALDAERTKSRSTLAASGALDSGRSAYLEGKLGSAKLGALSDYLAQVPLLNRKAQNEALQGQLGALSGASNLTVPYGSTTTSNSVQDFINQLIAESTQNGSSSESANSSETKQQSSGLLNSILGGLINSGLGFLTGGLGNILGGGTFMTPKAPVKSNG